MEKARPFIFLLCLAVPCSAATVIVDANGTGDYPTIQAGIDAALEGDIIELQPGVYTGEGNRDIDFKGKAITVRSIRPNDLNVVAATVINCQGTEDDPHRGFNFRSGEGQNSVLSGLTITNGYGLDEPFGTKMYSAGGAIFCEGSSPRIENCNIKANSALHADGICCLSSSPNISHCSILGTPASTLSGAIHLLDSNAVIAHCTIANNSSLFSGAGIFCEDSDPIISYCVIANNSANRYGGGIYMSRGQPRESTPTITHCIISGNSAKDGAGGGIHCGSTTSPKITHCIITQNSASHVASHNGRGGGIACSGSKEPRISQCIISENSATNFGGGLSCGPTSAKITNCTITNNSAGKAGGGFYYMNTNFTNVLSNCILWHNAASTEPQIGGYSTIGGSTILYNNVQAGFPGKGNFEADPRFHADGYHLLAGSPCIDTGDPDYIPEPGETDIDGEPRVMGQRIDVGADETGLSGMPVIGFSSRSFTFDAKEAGPNPARQILLVYAIGPQELNWQVEEDCPWLDVTPTSGLSTGEADKVTLTVDIAGLAGGTYSCQLKVSDPSAANSPQAIDVCLKLLGPRMEVSPNRFVFLADRDDPTPPDQVLAIRNVGGGTLNWEIAHDCDWLEVHPASGSSTGEQNNVALGIRAEGLSIGTYHCTLTIAALRAEDPLQEADVTLTVGNLLYVPSEYSTIQTAVDAALDGDTIIVTPGIYTGDGNRDIDYLGKAITVRSVDPDDPNIVASTVIDCNATEADPHRGFKFRSGEDPNSVLTGLTIINGYAPAEEDSFGIWQQFGGAILCVASSPLITLCEMIGNDANGLGGGMANLDNSNPIIAECLFSSNWAVLGGGIANCISSPTVTRCTFTGNSAQSEGGGVLNQRSKATLAETALYGNSAQRDGGGVSNRDGRPTFVNCTFSENLADGEGGGMANDFSNPTMTNCTFTANSAQSGGAVHNRQSDGRLTRCMLLANLAYDEGGGMCNERSNPALTNCTFAENSAGDGGGIFNEWSSPKLANCLFHYNRASLGGAIYNELDDDRAELTNCILWRNRVWRNRDGGQMDETAQIYHGTPVINYCCVQGWTGGLGGVGNIGTDPRFVDEADRDYHLLPGSACIDAGDPLSSPGIGETDIDGEARIMGDRVDMGIDEFTSTSVTYFEISPTRFKLFAYIGDSPPGQKFAIRNGGIGTLDWTIDVSDSNWVQVHPDGGSSTGNIDEVTITVDSASLDWGEYDCTLTVFDPNAKNSPQTVHIDLVVRGPVISAYPGRLTFLADVGGPNPDDQVFSIRNSGGGTLNWTIAHADCDWLRVYPNGGSIRKGEVNDVTVSIDTTALNLGQYNCLLTISDPNAENSPRTVEVSLIVGPVIELYYRWWHRFQATVDGPNPEDRTLTIWNSGGGTLNWEITCDCNWLQASPSGGACTAEPNEVILSVDIADLTHGWYKCTLTISDPNALNNRQAIEVDLRVYGALIIVEPQEFFFRADANEPEPPDQIFTINESRIGTPNWEITYDCSWLAVTPTSGSSRSGVVEVTVSADATGLADGVHQCTLAISDPNAENSPKTVRVYLSNGQLCFPPDYSTYHDWMKLGGPDCWCAQYQCDGDVSGAVETFFSYRVYGKDLASVVDNWKKKIDDPTLNPCADIDHKAETFSKYRVYAKDLAIVVKNWKKKDTQLPGDCPRPE